MPDLLSNLRRALEDWDVVRAEQELNKPENSDWLQRNSWDVIPLVCEYITVQIEETGPHLVQCCQELLVIAATVGVAKENLIAILEQIDGFRSVLLVRRVLPALGIILLKIKDQAKSHSWSWALDTVACHLKTIPAPPNSGLEFVERLTLDLSESAAESLDLLDDLITFLGPLVECACSGETSKETEKRKEILVNIILVILLHPISGLSQHPEISTLQTEVLPRSFKPARKLVEFISALRRNMLRDILEVKPGKEDEEDSKISLGIYLYLVFGENMLVENIPQVYSHLELLSVSIPYIRVLLENNQEIFVFKGVLLLKSLLQRIPADWLVGSTSDDPQLLSLVDPLTKVIVYNSVRETRETGFSCFTLLVNIFNAEARFNLYKYLFNTLQHSGLLGWTVTHLKNTLALCFKDPALYPGYTEDKICALLSKLFHLEHGVETDLLEISDELISEINLGIYLAARCPENLTKVAAFKSTIKAWANQIQEALKMSKAHWELKHKNESGAGPDVKIQVGGQNLPSMDKEQMGKVINSALTTLDIIQFNLVSLLNKLE